MSDEPYIVPFHEWEGKDAYIAGIEPFLAGIIKRSEKEWLRSLTREQAIDTVKMLAENNGPYGLQATILNGSHLLVWTFDAPWYAAGERWIIEQFFARVGRGSSAKAFAAIDLLAEVQDATGVLMATSLADNDQALGRLLHSHGYKPMSSQHLKPYN